MNLYSIDNKAWRLHDKTIHLLFFVLLILNEQRYQTLNDNKKRRRRRPQGHVKKVLRRRSLLYFTIRLSIKFSLHFLYSPFSPSKYLKTENKHALQTHTLLRTGHTHIML